MIGVPETLREMSFDVIVDDFPKQRMKFIEPMMNCKRGLTSHELSVE
jgi:hypothetical protein